MVCLHSGSPNAPQSSSGMQALLYSSMRALILQVCLHAACVWGCTAFYVIVGHVPVEAYRPLAQEEERDHL